MYQQGSYSQRFGYYGNLELSACAQQMASDRWYLRTAYITADVLPACLNGWRDGELATAFTGSRPLRLPCMGAHEVRGIGTQCGHKR
jgi:hypothetical protein